MIIDYSISFNLSNNSDVKYFIISNFVYGIYDIINVFSTGYETYLNINWINFLSYGLFLFSFTIGITTHFLVLGLVNKLKIK